MLIFILNKSVCCNPSSYNEGLQHKFCNISGKNMENYPFIILVTLSFIWRTKLYTLRPKASVWSVPPNNVSVSHLFLEIVKGP